MMLGRHVAQGDPELAIDANQIIEMSKQQTAAEPSEDRQLPQVKRLATLK